MRRSSPAAISWACRPAACSRKPVSEAAEPSWSANAWAARQSERRSSSDAFAVAALLGSRRAVAARAGGGATRPPSSVTVATTTCPSERPAPLRADALEARAERGERVAGRLAADAVERGARAALAAIRSPAYALARGGDDAVGGRGADAAARRLHGAPERLRVGGVGEQREVGERVADLGALVQAEAAEHAVRDPGGGQRGLDGPGGVSGAREHEHLGRGACRRRARRRQRRRPMRLRRVRRRTRAVDSPAGAAHRDQRLGGPVRVVGDAVRGGVRGSRRASGSCARARSGGGPGSARRSAGCCAARRSGSGRSPGRRRRPRDVAVRCRRAASTSAACASLVSCISSTTSHSSAARRCASRCGCSRSSRTASPSRSSNANALQRSSSASQARHTAAISGAAGWPAAAA